MFTIDHLTNDSGFQEIEVTKIGGQNTLFSDDETIIVTFARTGDAGTSGTAGSSGSAGSSGFLTINNSAEDRLISINADTETGDAEANLTFDGNELNVTGKTFLVGTSGTTGYIQMSQRDDVSGNKPTLSAGESAVFSASSGAGGTGIYFKQGTGDPDELVSRKKAITYGLIF